MISGIRESELRRDYYDKAGEKTAQEDGENGDKIFKFP